MSENLFAKVNDLKICYNVKGIGFPVFLIHGYAKKEFWIGQIDELAKQFQVVWFDNRGVGKSERPNIPYSMKMLVDDLKGLMDFLEVQQAHLIGHSLGSMIAQHFALSHPERINKLILMSTTAAVPDETGVEMFKNIL